MGKAALFERIDETESDLKRIAQDLWENPELGLHEGTSAEILIEALAEEGFDIVTGVGGMPTAFVASYGENGQKVGILGEYDGLPGLSQKVSPEREPVEHNGPGHGCGHDLFRTAGVGAAIAVKTAIAAGTKVRIAGAGDDGESREGTVSQRLPDGVSSADISSVDICCERFGTPFGYAKLSLESR